MIDLVMMIRPACRSAGISLEVTRNKCHIGQCHVEMGTSSTPHKSHFLTVKGTFARSKGSVSAVGNVHLNQLLELIHQCSLNPVRT